MNITSTVSALALALLCLGSQDAALAQSSSPTSSTRWRCEDPKWPMRFADKEENKSAPPECKRWAEIRGLAAASIEELNGRKFLAANDFLLEAVGADSSKYPVTVTGDPVRVVDLHAQPAMFGFTTVNGYQAKAGSLVLFEGFGGVLVEVRDSPTSAWRKEVLYPSRSAGFELRSTALNAMLSLDPVILSPRPRM